MRRMFPLLVCLLVIVAPLVIAQPEGPPPGDQRGWERIEQLRKVRMIEMLNLTENQSVRFLARLKEHDAVRQDLMRQKNEALDKIERLIRNNADSTEYFPLFSEVQGIDGRVASERKKFFDGLSDILSVEQRGKMLVFERRFERELRDAFREAQRRRHQGGNEE